jgi:hypothetical protein
LRWQGGPESCKSLAGVQAVGSAADRLSMVRQYLSKAFRLPERGDPFNAAEKAWARSNTPQRP